MGLSTWTLETKCELYGKCGVSCPVWTYGFLIVLLQVTYLPLLHLEALKYLNLRYRLHQLHFSSLVYTEILNVDLHFSNIFCVISQTHILLSSTFSMFCFHNSFSPSHMQDISGKGHLYCK